MTQRRVRFGMATPSRPVIEGERGLDEFETWIAHAEACGAELLAMGEAPTIFEDSFVYLAAAARKTERILLGHSTTVPGIRHPAVMASSLSTVHRLSGGRAYLGIGTGAVALVDVGEKPWRADKLAEYATTVRALTRGEEVEYEGKTFQMRWSEGEVPLFLGAEGPKALRLAGRVGDGAIIGTSLSGDTVRFAREQLAAGAAEEGRSVDDLQVWWQTRIHISSSVEEGLHAPVVEEYLARHARHVYRYMRHDPNLSLRENLIAQRGLVLTEEQAEAFRLFNEEYSQEEAVAQRYGEGSRNVQLMDKHGIREWIGPMCWITGTVDQAAKRIQELADAGATNFITVHMRPDRMETISKVGEVFASVS